MGAEIAAIQAGLPKPVGRPGKVPPKNERAPATVTRAARCWFTPTVRWDGRTVHRPTVGTGVSDGDAQTRAVTAPQARA